MLKIDNNLATALPFWLVAAAVVSLAVRAACTLLDHVSPGVPREKISWVKPASLANANSDGKLILYYFTADWCDACHRLNDEVLSNRDVVNTINQNYLAVRVVDRAVEDRVNSPEVRELEDHFDADKFPQLIVSLPNGQTIDTQAGLVSGQTMLRFLNGAVKLSSYARGLDHLRRGEYELADSCFNQYIAEAGWKQQHSAASAMVKYAAMGLAGKPEERRRQAVSQALASCNPNKWPYPILQYLNKEISATDLSRKAGDWQSTQIDVHCFVGLENYFSGDKDAARVNLSWVVNKAPHDGIDYLLAYKVLGNLK